MSVTYAWSFPQFDVAKSEGNLVDVVKTIHWRYDATDGEFSAGAYGTVGLSEPDPNAFVPFDQITEYWAVTAVSSNVDLAEIQASLENQINSQKNPPVIKMVPPFMATE